MPDDVPTWEELIKGMIIVEPTDDDMEWAKQEMARRNE